MLRSLLWLEEVSSTQEVAKRVSVGTVVVANRQTSGRGRLGRHWHSPEGGLYFSFSIPAGVKDEATLPLVIAHSVASYLKALGFMPAIKWVNDLYVGGKKVCGVLTERLRDRIVIGVGINLNQESFPKDLEAISLRMLSGKTFDKVSFLLELLVFLERDIDKLNAFGFVAFKQAIEDRLLFKDSEVILYTPEPVVGILKGISEEGSLLLLTQEGLKSFSVGDLTLRAL